MPDPQYGLLAQGAGYAVFKGAYIPLEKPSPVQFARLYCVKILVQIVHRA